MDARAQILISGRVQGVFFRSWLRNHSKIRNLTGYARNTEDGSLEAVLEGQKEAIQEIIDRCHDGPGTASVTEVKVEWLEPTKSFESFEIR
ncbi:MAG: acylphosphatase [Candidatus Aenigmarchaeota archaeon]|nr:acylphosphatase [Candidatus Aenigmarchaeota archaeon]